MTNITEQTDMRAAAQWSTIDWGHVEAGVRRLQERIYRATGFFSRCSRLEPCAGRLARTVLRGPGGGNVARLPDYANPKEADDRCCRPINAGLNEGSLFVVAVQAPSGSDETTVWCGELRRGGLLV